MMLNIHLILAEQTWAIRQQAMWADKPLSFVKLPQDHEGIHFGLSENGELLSVVSGFITGNELQFRKFATLPTRQGQGLGSKLLAHLISYAQQNSIQKIWCNARTEKITFYEKFGLTATPIVFEQDNISYVKMEKQLKAPFS